MNVESAKYMPGGNIQAIIDGMAVFVPDDLNNRYRLVLSDWETAGHSILPYVEPAIPPAPLPRLSFWLAAVEIGVTKAGVRARIDAMPEGVDKKFALVYLEDAERYRRTDPLLNAMAEAEGITQVQLDALWTWALDNYV